MKELWDAYDINFNKINNMTLVRGEPLPEGVYHLVCEIIVKHTDGTYLLMQRDFQKKNYGGMWELSAGGAALQGESSEECAIRELREETGIIASEIHEIGRAVHNVYNCLFVEFLCVTDCAKNSIVLQDGETVNYKWVDRSSMLGMGDELASKRTVKAVKELGI